VNIDEQMRRSEISVGNKTIATYVWGNPARQPYALLVHGWSSFAPYVSPMFADLAGLPPIYLQVGGDEGLLDDSVMFAERARES
jgi:acetyl esterase/lipase